MEGPKDTEGTGRSGRKPRASRAGTRSVASLSAEQLTRKRANDREAQRAIRQRQKDYIASLERRISELSSSKDSDKSLEDAQRRNSELEEELRLLRQRLHALRNGASSLELTYFASELSSVSYPNPWASEQRHVDLAGCAPATVPTAVGTLHSPSPNQVVQCISLHNKRPGSMCPPTFHPLSSTATNESPFDTRSSTMPIRSELMGHGIPSSFVNQPSLQFWELPLRFAPAKGQMENVMISIIQRQRSLALGGTTGTALTGPYRPTLQCLLRPDLSNSTHPVLFVLSNILRGLTYRSTFEKIGTLLVLYPVFQWQISHTFETYSNLPEWCRPQPTQMTTPHPVWITYIGWPKLREIVIANQEVYATEEFQYLYTISVNANWPYRPADALVFEGGDLRVSEAFARHVRQLANWSLDEPFQRRYPELREYCTFTEDRVPVAEFGSGGSVW